MGTAGSLEMDGGDEFEVFCGIPTLHVDICHVWSITLCRACPSVIWMGKTCFGHVEI